MPSLDRRGAGRLLRTVGGREHATEKDHEPDDCMRDGSHSTEAPMPTPPNSDRSSRPKRKNGTAPLKPAKVEVEDDEREPESSSSEAESDKSGARGGSTSRFRKAATIVFTEPVEESRSSFRRPTNVLPPKSPERKLLSDKELDEGQSDSEPGIFGESKRKKSKRPRQEPPDNIHAKPAKGKGNVFARTAKLKTFGNRGRDDREKEQAKKKDFVKPKTILEPAETKARFVRHDVPARQFGGIISSQTSAGDFQITGGAAGDRQAESSSPLSSLEASPEPDSLTFDCETCSRPVNKLLHEEYEDEYVKGRQWTMKRQEQFCEWHRKQTAHETWKDRGYPAIDWTGLAKRMRKHDSFLIDVLNDEAISHHRSNFKKQSRSKGMKGGFKGNAKPGAAVGYYGPKGEKMMSDHIIQQLSTDIRERATKDQLVATSGFQGGVSGFVQAVLVPHLAELLVKDDMKLAGDWEVKAREIIADSVEVGELMHPELEDLIVEVEDDE
ncbi:hypothetical protein TI39_contig5827g00021 [Zymoseptoria brevis]|uniref:Restriction of telomere capping protein 4 n=1 Tax=Zymoseptoria brevis TaxID=1047168 RepID=A0A0F4G5X3_9PEZI|nr:hypothetical protein TI39_contig5827g00021 [Zymoseptoria brevis]